MDSTDAKSRRLLADADLTQQPAYVNGGVSDQSAPVSGRWNNAFTGTLDSSSLVWIVPLALAAIYFVVFIANLSHNISELGWISDYASGFTLPETLVHTGTGGHTVVASSGQWVSLWFGLLTATLPFHHELWGVAPTLLFIFTAMTIGWSVAQVANRRAAVLAVLLVLVVSQRALMIFMASVAHNSAYPCAALLGAYLIWLTRWQGRRPVISVVMPLLAGVVLGACLASDLLILPITLIPLAATALLALARRNRRSQVVALSALTTVVVGVFAAKLTSSVMVSLGYLTLPTPSITVPVAQLSQQAQLLWSGLQSLFNGYLGQADAPGFLHTELGVACDVLIVATLLTLLVLGTLTTVKFILSGWRNTGSETPVQLARSLHVIYWVGSAVGACMAFWLRAETRGTVTHESYYATVIFSVAAVIPLLMTHSKQARWIISVGASIFFIASLAGFSNQTIKPVPVARYQAKILALARANGLQTGYAGYWDASSLTWSANNRVVVRPLMECENPEGAGICPFYMMRTPSWYVPAERHTFLLVDSTEAWVGALPAGLGRPIGGYAFGPLKMYVYPYDIASRLGAPLF